MADDGPSIEQQAEYLVRKLEQTIRDNRSVKGMSFRTWQTIAREEITNTLKAAEKRRVQQLQGVGRSVMIASTSLVSLGFWGVAVIADQSYGPIAGLVCLIAGAALFYVFAERMIGRLGGDWTRRKRAERLRSIEDLDRRIKRMEDLMRKKHDGAKEKLEEMGLM